VYGDGKSGFSDKKEDQHLYEALNLYGRSKLDFDKWVLNQGNKTPPLWFGLRYFNVYGPFESHKNAQASMVYHGYRQVLERGIIRLFKSNDPTVYKHGDQVRDFIYVKDVVDVTLALSKLCIDQKRGTSTINLPENGLLLNLGTGKTRTWNDLAKGIFKTFDFEPNIEYINMPSELMLHYQNYTCADMTTFQSLNIDHSFVDLEEGVYTYINKFLMRGL
jgi:ADP-L-glycero-D-manno-heptose 6-epimerase